MFAKPRREYFLLHIKVLWFHSDLPLRSGAHFEVMFLPGMSYR